MSDTAKDRPEYPSVYEPRARIVCAASYAAWLGGGDIPHLDQVIVGTPLLAAAVSRVCPLCRGAVEIMPPPEAVEIGEG